MQGLLDLVGLGVVRNLAVLLPVGLLLGVMLALGRLYHDSEMTAVVACGVEPLRIYAPIALLALAVAMLVGWLSLRAGPEAAAGVHTPAEWAYALKAKLYKRAVYNRAKAQALPQFATVTRRESAENTGKEAPERAETFLAFSQQAVRALQGRGPNTAAFQ